MNGRGCIQQIKLMLSSCWTRVGIAARPRMGQDGTEDEIALGLELRDAIWHYRSAS